MYQLSYNNNVQENVNKLLVHILVQILYVGCCYGEVEGGF
jgi:hypothetical protein